MQRHFYATSADLIQVFDRFERKHKVAYTRTGSFDSPSHHTFHAGRSISTLSSPAPHPNADAGYTYLVTPEGMRIASREIELRAGGIRYAVDQLINPISITFTHGGFYAPGILLFGRVATCSDHPDAARLYRAFASSIGKVFSRVQMFYVGPQALELLKKGCRLTIGANSPRDYDLAFELPSDIA